MKFLSRLAVFAVFAGSALAQTQAPTQPASNVSSTGPNSGDINTLVSRIEQETQGLNEDVGKLRIEKWKTDSSTRQQASENAASIQRNITATFPELLSGVRSNPQSLAANFKLYRYLNALYDVTSNLAESAGAFGKGEEYNLISPHVTALEEARRSYADLLQQMATSADNRIALAQKAQAATVAAPLPKKIIVDDTDTAPAPKKKKAKKSTSNSSSATSSTPQ
jgi:hypothetical protein